MAVSKKVNTKQRLKMKYVVSIAIILIGILFQILEIGGNTFAGFPSLGIWIIFTGCITLAIVIINSISNKEKLVDERAEHIGYKAARMTSILLIIALFITMVADGIQPIHTRYYLYASFLVMFYILSYIVSYKLIERNS